MSEGWGVVRRDGSAGSDCVLAGDDVAHCERYAFCEQFGLSGLFGSCEFSLEGALIVVSPVKV